MEQKTFGELPVGGLFLDQAQASYATLMDLNVYEKLDKGTALNLLWTNRYNDIFKDYFDEHDKVLILDDAYISDLEYKLSVLQIKAKTYQETIAKYCLFK